MNSTGSNASNGLKWRAEQDKIQPSRAAQQGGADPVMIRAYSGGHKGATAFFRNRPFLHALLSLLASKAPDRCRVLVHACSVGAEPYSLALWCLKQRGEAVPKDLQIIATDIEPAFIEVAQRGVYPVSVLEGMTEEEKGWFAPHPDGVQVPEEARRMVQFLPPMTFIDGDPGGEFDAVLVMNAFTYVTAEEQGQALQRIATYTRHVLGLTAFHPDAIKGDIDAIGFQPYEQDQEKIHHAWGDRLAAAPVLPSAPEYSWKIPPYNQEVPDYLHRYCALFVRP